MSVVSHSYKEVRSQLQIVQPTKTRESLAKVVLGSLLSINLMALCVAIGSAKPTKLFLISSSPV